MKRLFAAMCLLSLAVPTSAEVIEFKSAKNWVSVPDDGSGGPFVLIWAHPRGLGEAGTQFFTPVEVSESTFSVSRANLPDIQVIPESDLVAWVLTGLVLVALAGMRRIPWQTDRSGEQAIDPNINASHHRTLIWRLSRRASPALSTESRDECCIDSL